MQNNSYCAVGALFGTKARRVYRSTTPSLHTGQGKRRRNAATAARVERENAEKESLVAALQEAMTDKPEAAEQAKRERRNAAARERRQAKKALINLVGEAVTV